jgi:uncharacterized protein YndB with AHSA1/START domain
MNDDKLTLTFERTLRASRDQVFDAWTRPEEISEWWDPTGAKLASCAIDLRPGGTFTFVNQGHSPPFSGIYRVIERPARLVFEVQGSVGTVALEREGDLTRMRVTIRCATAEQLEQFAKFGVRENTEKTLDNLVRRFSGAPRGVVRHQVSGR